MRRTTAALALTALLTSGCAAVSGQERAAAEGAAPLTAAASVFPLAWMARQVAPEADVQFLGSGSAEAHDLELTPAQREAVGKADVLLYMGEIGYQPQIEQAAGSADGEVVDVSEIAGEDRMLVAAEDAHAGEEEDEHAGEEDEHAGEGALDPHVWFDAGVMADVAQRIGEAFAAADPDRADTYTANADRVQEELASSAEVIEDVLGAECRFDEVIVSHAAYGYLLEPHGYSQHAVVGVTSGEAGGSGAALAEIVAEIEQEGFEHVVAEPVEGRADAEAVARETGTQLLDVFPLDVVDDEQAEQGYPALLRQQAETFGTALGCS